MRGLILRSWEVIALLDTGKVTVQRAVRPNLTPLIGPSLPRDSLLRARPMRRQGYRYMGTDDGVEISLRPPFGLPGERRFVRETFCVETNYDTGPEYAPPFNDGRPVVWRDEDGARYWEQCHYRASDPTPQLAVGNAPPGVIWSSSVHCTEERSRLVIVNISTRVEPVGGTWTWVGEFERVSDVDDPQGRGGPYEYNGGLCECH